MKKTLIIFIALLFASPLFSQITKGNWMVGGSADVAYRNIHSDNNSSKNTFLNLSAGLGYFFMDKFVGGVRPSFRMNRTKHSGSALPNFNLSKNQSLGIGPFVRYYFLPTENLYNLILDLAYHYEWNNSKTMGTSETHTLNNFTVSAEPVIYFNSSVGLEFLLNYTSEKPYGTGNKRNNSFGAGIGFQIHLEKE